ncbi:MAG: cytochrome c3 family protein [Acidobacteriota bacterium]
MSSEPRSTKGHYGPPKLPVARAYPLLANRRTMVALGLLVALVLLAVTAWNVFFAGGTLLAGGPVSSAHASFEQDCQSCHGGGFQKVADDACATCHEKAGDPVGTFTFAAHAIYRSGDFQRTQTHDDALACATCHVEHRGRESDLVAITDRVCATCHDRSHFDRDHPEFAFTGDPEGDDDAIAFAHGPHVREVMERGGWGDLERACLACHQPTEDGRQFEPIDFDRHCDACHLDAGVATSRLPIASADGEPGVWSLDAIRASGLPGTDWAAYTNPDELRGGGRRVVKTPVHHEDAWILWNLRWLRQMRYPDAGLADYLHATPDLDTADAHELYEEMVDVLERQAIGLRGTADPAIQEQLEAIERRLSSVRDALRDPSTPLDETALALALTEPVELPVETLDAWNEVVDGLTGPCVTCHQIEAATIVRVREDQRAMPRAEFDHGAHVIQRRCLDCHGELPILEALSSADEASDEVMAWDPADDRSAIHNLPRIAVCRDCHQSGQVASRCIDCHQYHPDANRHADLLLYLE